MKRSMLVLPLLVLLTGLVFGGGFFLIYGGANAPAPTVAARALDAEPLDSSTHTNAPLEATPAESPTPEPANPAPEPKPEPKQEPTTQPVADSPVEAMKTKLEKALDASNLSEADKEARIRDIAKALAQLEENLTKNAVTVSGRVIDPAGQPVAGASVIANSQIAGDEAIGRRKAASQRSIAVTDAEGNFSGTYYAPSDAALSLDLYAQHKLFLPSERETIDVTPGTPYEGVALVMKQAAGITGRVVDQDFNAIEGARVMILSGGKWGGRALSAMTDAGGDFTVGGMTPGDYTLSVTCIGYTPPKDSPKVSITAGEPTRLSADIVMTRVTSLELKLVCAEQTPSGYFTVTFYSADGKSRGGTGIADKDGKALIQNPPEDTIELVVSLRGYNDSERIRVSVYKGAHTDIGEVTLTAVEEQARATEEDKRTEEIRKLREKLKSTVPGGPNEPRK
ncbi:MAG: carboxypeptidase regulatory-like domain-containing protein [Planctomycetes bacterium]|nr:carboxypeptidase regulatory-like domain-containing protein [Planctomycetota bacterium]